MSDAFNDSNRVKDTITLSKAIRFARMALQAIQGMGGPQANTYRARIALERAVEAIQDTLDGKE